MQIVLITICYMQIVLILMYITYLYTDHIEQYIYTYRHTYTHLTQTRTHAHTHAHTHTHTHADLIKVSLGV